MRKIVMTFGVVLTVVLSVTVLGAQDCPCIWVDPEVPLQAQIDAALPGSTLCLPQGTWSEAIVIAKSLTLRGEGPGQTIIAAPPGDPLLSPVIWVTGPWRTTDQPISVAIEGLTVDGHAEGWGLANAGLLVDGMAQVMLHNCHIRESGILLRGDSQTLVNRTKILGEQRPRGSRFQEIAGIGVELRGRAQATILQSEIAGWTDGFGVFANERAQVIVHGSTIENAGHSVYIHDDAQATIAHTHIANSLYGVVLLERAQAHIAYSTIVDNYIGIGVIEYAAAVLTRNRITGSMTYGVRVPVQHPWLWFKGVIGGVGNEIPCPDEPGGNRMGAIEVEDLAFLMTEEGGMWTPRRP
jgi:nitrous oxidase accessory protein NosD